MQPCLPRPRALAALAVALLSSMICLGLTTGPPSVDLADLRFLDDGQEVVVRGLLVDIRRYDSGFESLTMASGEGRDTLRLQVSPGRAPQPSEYARLGDSVRALGRLSVSGPEPLLYCDGDSVSVEVRSEAALTIRVLSDAWPLFLGDELRLRGLLVSPVASEGCRLFDLGLVSSIALNGTPVTPGTGPFEAVVIGTLRLDSGDMSLFIQVAAVWRVA